MHQDELDLTVKVTADNWGYAQRRIAFLETVLIRLMRDEWGPQEWFSAAELASLRLPGLPDSKDAITRRARSGKWARMRSGPKENGAYRYHVIHLPSRAFDELVRRILDLPAGASDHSDASALWDELVDAAPPPPTTVDDNTAPAWVLPLMRLIKGKASGNLSVAWQELPRHVPDGVALPSVEEAAAVLLRWGLV